MFKIFLLKSGKKYKNLKIMKKELLRHKTTQKGKKDFEHPGKFGEHPVLSFLFKHVMRPNLTFLFNSYI